MTGPQQDADFTDEFCAFLQSTIPTVDAAEILLLLRGEPDQRRSTADLVRSLTPAGGLTEADAARYLDALEQRGLVVRDAEGKAAYRSVRELEPHVDTLARVYQERPVTLFRMIYALRDSKIKTLADAFRIWRK